MSMCSIATPCLRTGSMTLQKAVVHLVADAGPCAAPPSIPDRSRALDDLTAVVEVLCATGRERFGECAQIPR